MLAFSLVTMLLTYLALRLQHLLPLNPQRFPAVVDRQAFETAASFTTNTNWQSYSGESTMSYLSQMMQLAYHNFISAATGMGIAVAVVRGLTRRSAGRIGNFWADLVRGTLYVLLPASLLLSLLLVQQGVIQNLHPYLDITTLEGGKQTLAMGPVASQEVIKQLGTNGGGFFNANAAHPFENPTPWTNFLSMVLIFAIPSGMVWMFGRMVGNVRHGWAVWAAMFTLFFAGVSVAYWAEARGNPIHAARGVNVAADATQPGGNMEGKEVRFGIANSALWSAVTTVTSCGAVNAALESLTGIGSLVPFSNLSLSETVFGGVGTGLYSMLLYVLLAVFIGGLMVGRTPEFLGKKIEPRDVKLVAVGAFFTPFMVLFASSLALATKYGKPSIFASARPQAFSETLYAYLSQANNNGSAFAGYTGYYQPNPGNLGAHGITFADLLGGVTMLTARYLPILVVLAVAGSLVRKRTAPMGLGTMRTDTPTFAVLLTGTVVLVGALTFFPALLLGPIVQGMTTRLF
jgi:K+-transporting ATPase ATPase A chain